jgi:hypothetical protein
LPDWRGGIEDGRVIDGTNLGSAYSAFVLRKYSIRPMRTRANTRDAIRQASLLQALQIGYLRSTGLSILISWGEIDVEHVWMAILQYDGIRLYRSGARAELWEKAIRGALA